MATNNKAQGLPEGKNPEAEQFNTALIAMQELMQKGIPSHMIMSAFAEAMRSQSYLIANVEGGAKKVAGVSEPANESEQVVGGNVIDISSRAKAVVDSSATAEKSQESDPKTIEKAKKKMFGSLRDIYRYGDDILGRLRKMDDDYVYLDTPAIDCPDSEPLVVYLTQIAYNLDDIYKRSLKLNQVSQRVRSVEDPASLFGFEKEAVLSIFAKIEDLNNFRKLITSLRNNGKSKFNDKERDAIVKNVSKVGGEPLLKRLIQFSDGKGNYRKDELLKFLFESSENGLKMYYGEYNRRLGSVASCIEESIDLDYGSRATERDHTESIVFEKHFIERASIPMDTEGFVPSYYLTTELLPAISSALEQTDLEVYHQQGQLLSAKYSSASKEFDSNAKTPGLELGLRERNLSRLVERESVSDALKYFSAGRLEFPAKIKSGSHKKTGETEQRVWDGTEF